MNTIKLTVGAVDSGMNGAKQMSGLCEDSAARAGRAAGELSELRFSSQEVLAANIRSIQKRLSKQANLMEQYTAAMREVQNELMAADGSFGAESASLWDRARDWVSDNVQKVSLALKNAFLSHAAVAGLCLSGGSTSIITHANRLFELIKNWLRGIGIIGNVGGESDHSTEKQNYSKRIVDVLSTEKNHIESATAQKYWSWYYGKESSRSDGWCAVFVSYMMEQAGIDVEQPVADGSTWFKTSPEYQLNYFEQAGCLECSANGYQAKVGDLVFYRGGDGGVGHVAIVCSVENGEIITLHGNVGSGRILEIPESYYRNENGQCEIIGYGNVASFAEYQSKQ